MVKARVILALMLLLSVVMISAAPGSKTLLRFDNPLQSVDSVRFDGGNITLVYHFQNVSSRKVSILEVHSTCGCFAGSVKKNVLEPGERSQLLAVFAPATLYGTQNRHLTVVVSDGSQTIMNSVGMTGYVIRDLSEGQIRYAEDLGGGIRTDTQVNVLRKDRFGDYVVSIPLYNDTDKHVRIGVHSSTWRFVPRCPESIPPHSRVDLRGRFNPWLRRHGRPIEVTLEIDAEGARITPLKVIGTIN